MKSDEARVRAFAAASALSFAFWLLHGVPAAAFFQAVYRLAAKFVSLPEPRM